MSLWVPEDETSYLVSELSESSYPVDFFISRYVIHSRAVKFLPIFCEYKRFTLFSLVNSKIQNEGIRSLTGVGPIENRPNHDRHSSRHTTFSYNHPRSTLWIRQIYDASYPMTTIMKRLNWARWNWMHSFIFIPLLKTCSKVLFYWI